MVENFNMPQRDLFGFCDNFKSASFLKNVDSLTKGSCVQPITNLSKAVDTFLNPLTYSLPEYLTGSSQGSQSAKFTVAKIFIRDTASGEVTEKTDSSLYKPAYVSESN